jgi:hypothetical protein
MSPAERTSLLRGEHLRALSTILNGLARAGLNFRDALVRIGNALTTCFRSAVDTDELAGPCRGRLHADPRGRVLELSAASRDNFAVAHAGPLVCQGARPYRGQDDWSEEWLQHGTPRSMPEG